MSKTRAGFFKRGKYWWYRSDPVTGKASTTRSKTVSGSEEWLKERERLATNPAYAASHKATFGSWVTTMLRDKEADGDIAPETVSFYRCKAGHLVRILGEDTSLSDVGTPGTVDQYLEQRRREGASHYTISKEFTALRQVLKRAARAGVYGGNLSVLFPDGFGHGYTPRDAVLTPEDEAVLRVRLKPPQWAAVAFILATSARVGELQRAQLGDYDQNTHLCLLRGTKTKASWRTVPVVTMYRQYMLEALPHIPFAWADGITAQLPKRAESWGCPRVTPNDIRRTCATRLIEAGVDAYLVAKITGHVSLKMLKEVYDKASPAKTLAAIEAQIAQSEKEKES